MTAPARTVTIPFFMTRLLGEISFSPATHRACAVRKSFPDSIIFVHVVPVGSEPLSNFDSTKVTKKAIRGRLPRNLVMSTHGLIVNFLVGGVRCALGVEMPLLGRAPSARLSP